MNHLRSLALLVAIGGSVLAWSAAPVLAADPSSSPTATQSTIPATPKFGIGAGPSQVILGPTDTSGAFTVFNASDVDVSIAVTAYDFVTDSSGKRVKSAQPLPVGLAQWVTLSPATFDLAPQASQRVTLTVNRPTDASPGDHYAVVEAGGTVTDAVWKQLQVQAGGGSVLRSRIAFPVTMVTRVPGTIDSTLATDLAIPSPIFTWGPDYSFTPAILDKGNVAAAWIPAAGTKAAPETIVPTLKLTSGLAALAPDALLYDLNKDGTPATLLVLPGATKVQTFTLKDVPILGSYEYTYKLPGNAGDNRSDITANGHFVIVNLQKVVLFVVLPLAALLLLFVLWRLGRRRGRNKLERERARIRREVEAELRHGERR